MCETIKGYHVPPDSYWENKKDVICADCGGIIDAWCNKYGTPQWVKVDGEKYHEACFADLFDTDMGEISQGDYERIFAELGNEFTSEQLREFVAPIQ